MLRCGCGSPGETVGELGEDAAGAAKLFSPGTEVRCAASVERDGKIRYTAASSMLEALAWLERIERRVASAEKKELLVPDSVEGRAKLLRPIPDIDVTVAVEWRSPPSHESSRR